MNECLSVGLCELWTVRYLFVNCNATNDQWFIYVDWWQATMRNFIRSLDRGRWVSVCVCVCVCVCRCLCVCVLFNPKNKQYWRWSWMDESRNGSNIRQFPFGGTLWRLSISFSHPIHVSTWRNENFSNSIFSQIVRQMKWRSTSERALSSFRCRLSFLCVVAALFFSHSHTQWEMNAGVAAEEERKKLITAHRRWDR